MKREASLSRKTKETDISIKISLDGTGVSEINTGIGFFDHMLELFSRHGLFDVTVKADGDISVDAHHTVEDVGIVLGKVLGQAIGDKKSIKRYGTAFVPMDESLAMVSLDLSGRPFLIFECMFTQDKVGEMDTEMVEEFFRALAFNAGITLHVKVLYGSNNHHMCEAVFKAFARALDEAISIDSRIDGIMSTKGAL